MSDPLDVAIMQRIARENYTPAINRAHGPEGVEALREVLEFLPKLFAHIESETIQGVLYVARRLPARQTEDLDASVSGAFRIETRIDRLPNRVTTTLFIELLDNGAYRLSEPSAIDEGAASRVAIVYKFVSRRDLFVIEGKEVSVPNPAPVQASVFARPTFGSLLDALQDYRDRMVRTCTCFILQQAWETQRRLFFKPGPELTMRRSLHQFLTVRLRDAEVRPEQIVDESHPVDIKVTWALTNRLALIEIKWLGKSREGAKITSEHFDQRAREGARQLSEYMDANRTAAPHRETRGYLVVIDGRRRGLGSNATKVSVANGMYYADKEIDYNPKYHEVRSDFEVPVRMFVEAICEA